LPADIYNNIKNNKSTKFCYKGKTVSAMMSVSEQARLDAIMSRLNILYGLDNLNPIIEGLLNDLVLDVDWLQERLSLAWTTVAAYQKELSGNL